MIEIENLSVRWQGAEAIRDASLTITAGERLGVVGESGSGKTLLALTLMGMAPEGMDVSGAIRVDGHDMATAGDAAWRRLRARRVAMIFQEPMAALNPLRTVGDTVAEPMRLHDGASRAQARRRVLDLFEETGIPDPERRLSQYPHELSGGQRQRVLIALALACNPGLLIADEPTTALDAHVALRITELLVRLARDRNMALMFISHDLAAVSRTTERILVMYCGDIVERGPTAGVLHAPSHPYTQGLIAARPALVATGGRRRLATIRGSVPALGDMAAGCRFAGRCARELPVCGNTRPDRAETGPDASAVCHLLTQRETA